MKNLIFLCLLLGPHFSPNNLWAIGERDSYRCFHQRHELNPHKDMFANFETLSYCPYWIKRLSTYKRHTTRYLLEAVIEKDDWLQCQYHHPDNKVDLITCHFRPVKQAMRSRRISSN